MIRHPLHQAGKALVGTDEIEIGIQECMNACTRLALPLKGTGQRGNVGLVVVLQYLAQERHLRAEVVTR